MKTEGSSRVVVTGALGLVGANLVRLLINKGYDVAALIDCDSPSLDGVPVRRIRGDILDSDSLCRAFNGAEAVFHLAAVISLNWQRDPHASQVNVEGVSRVVDACIACGVRRLVHFSSIHALSPYPMGETVDETRSLCGKTEGPVYDRSKAEGERVALEGGHRDLEVVVVNPTGVLGPHDYRPSPIGEVLMDLYVGRLPVLVEAGFNWVDVRDVCLGAEAAGRGGRPGERYILAGHHASIRELAELVHTCGGSAPPRLGLPVWLAYLGVPFSVAAAHLRGRSPKFTRASLRALRHHQDVSHAKASRELGYHPRPLLETVQDTLSWFLGHGDMAGRLPAN